MNVNRKSYGPIRGVIRGVILLLVLSVFTSLVVSYASAYQLSDIQPSDIQWSDQGVSNKLQRGDVITYMGYSIEATAFPSPQESDRYRQVPVDSVNPFVGLNISKNGSLINTTMLAPGESYVTPDYELRVTVNDMPGSYAQEWLYESYNPWATVEVNPRGLPQLGVTVDTDKTEYVSSDDTEIVAVVRLENTGSADALNVDLNLQSNLSVKRGGLKYHYQKIPKGESVTETVAFASPMPTEDTKYDILANVTAVDIKDTPYTANSLKTISISVDPDWSMSFRKSLFEKMYLKETAMVTLTLKNNGKYDINNVTIEDSLSGGFRLARNDSLYWMIPVIPAGKEWEHHYFVETDEPNSEGTILPAAVAEFKIKKELYGVRSNEPKVVVYGPKIVLNKQTDVSEFNPGDTVTVTVTAKNSGSTPTKVTIRDELPQGATLTSGYTAQEEYLEAGKETKFSYALKMDSDQPVKLPPASAEYFKLGNNGGKISIKSQELELKIKPPEPVVTETPASTPEPMITMYSVPAGPENPNPSSPETAEKENESGEPKLVDSPSPEVTSILNLMLGCNDNSVSTNGSAAACNFFRQPKV